jgi:hypothetical protein
MMIKDGRSLTRPPRFLWFIKNIFLECVLHNVFSPMLHWILAVHKSKLWRFQYKMYMFLWSATLKNNKYSVISIISRTDYNEVSFSSFNFWLSCFYPPEISFIEALYNHSSWISAKFRFHTARSNWINLISFYNISLIISCDLHSI